jgi:hypothetical protein
VPAVPVNEQLVAAPAGLHAVDGAGLTLTVYPVIAEPPLEDGAVQATATVVGLVPPPVVRVTPVGVPGGAKVVADADPDAAPVPMALVAVTVTE